MKAKIKIKGQKGDCGAPHRIKYLDKALEYITSHEGVWITTGHEMISYYSKLEE